MISNVGTSSSAYRITCLSVMIPLLFCANYVCAVAPEQVLVVANKNMEGSTELAHYYQKVRTIPPANVFELTLPTTEDITRKEFTLFKEKLSEYVDSISESYGRRNAVSTIVLVFGVPLRVVPEPPDQQIKEEVYRLQRQLDKAGSEVAESGQARKTFIESLRKKMSALLKKDEIASVDSELMLLHYPGHTLSGWLKNPMLLGGQRQNGSLVRLETDTKIVTVARLDGQSVDTVHRMVDDVIHAEKYGLQGKAYFDARSNTTKASRQSAYGYYDQSILEAGAIVKKKMTTVIDSNQSLFAEKACPQTALYCGWYSLGKYIDSFDWVPGSIGYHIASSECVSLRKPNNSQWCASMLENGVAAVIGPVAEPYVQGFPLPALFFKELVENGRSLGESYMRTLPYLSWQMVLVGDPLYVPFPANRDQ